MANTIIRPNNTLSLQCGAVGQDSVSVEPDDYTFTPDDVITWGDVHNPEDDTQGDPYEGEQIENPFEHADDEVDDDVVDEG